MSRARLEHVGIVVDDLAAARDFFLALGFELLGEAPLEGGDTHRLRFARGPEGILLEPVEQTG